jgi:hypothetical protein
MPERLRTAYSRCARELIALDERLSRVPVLDRIAGALEVVARRTSA